MARDAAATNRGDGRQTGTGAAEARLSARGADPTPVPGGSTAPAPETLRRLLARFSPCFLGLVAIRIWLQCSIYDRYASTDSGVVTVTANIVRVALTVAILALVVRRGFPQRAKTGLGWASVGAMTVASALFLAHAETGSLGLLWAACLLAGFGIIWGGGMWIEFYARLPIREALLYAFACLALSCVAGFFLGLLPESIAHLVAMLMPAVSLVTYRSSMLALDGRDAGGAEACGTCAPAAGDGTHATVAGTARPAGAPAARPEGTAGALPYDDEPRSTFVRLLAGIALFNLALGFARGFPYGESIGLSVPFQAVHQFGTCLLCLALVWWALARRGGVRFSALWNLLVVLLGAGTLMLAALDPLLMEVGSTLITVANTFALGVMWFSSYDIARNSSIPSYVALGAVWVAHLLPREVGRVAILLVGPHDESPMILAVAMVVALAVSITLLVNDSIPRTRPFFAELRGGRGRTGDEGARGRAGGAAVGGAATGGAASDRMRGEGEGGIGGVDLDRALGAAARLYPLTQRELDIARLLAQGRSKSVIGEKLGLSESTVRTHGRHLYAKLDVHSRQQLIDLLEELAEADGGASR